MKQFKNISTLIFDFGGVLINLDLLKCAHNFSSLGIKNFENHLNLFTQSGFFLQFEKGEISVEQFRNEIRNLGTEAITDAQIDEAWGSFLCDIPKQKLEMLVELKAKFRLLLLSNTNALHIETRANDEFERIGKKMTDIFDKCYLSFEMGMAKPDAEIFEALLTNEGVKPEECLFLDDGIKNIEQASKLGIQTYLVKPNDDLSFLLNPESFQK